MPPSKVDHFADLHQIAVRALLHNGFLPVFSSAVNAELVVIQKAKLPKLTYDIQDLRELLWSSIDNVTTRDLDQLEHAEQLEAGKVRLRVAIADVDNFVRRDTAIDTHARSNTTSIYGGFATFPMLPEMLSNNKSSLRESEDRLAVVTDLILDAEGKVLEKSFYRALVRNHAQLNYDEVNDWLDGSAKGKSKPLRNNKDLSQQIKLQDQIAAKLSRKRMESGSLNFESSEAFPVMQDSKIVSLEIVKNTRSRHLVQSLMVEVNSNIADFLDDRYQPTIRRIVRKPARWNRIQEIARHYDVELPDEAQPKPLADFLNAMRTEAPEQYADLSLAIVKLIGSGEYVVQAAGAPAQGHFGLAVQDYTHSTAPNRRFVDLVIQRILKSSLGDTSQSFPYTETELEEIVQHCMDREKAARKVERMMRKTAAASFMANNIGDSFDGVITGVKSTGTFVRLNHPPAEGKIVKGENGLDVGDQVIVRLIATDLEEGHLDFALVKNKSNFKVS